MGTQAAAVMQICETAINARFRSYGHRGIDEHLIAVRREERLRIAQELHDTCLQGFLVVLMHLRAAACEYSDNTVLKSRLERLAEIACAAVEEGRRSVQTLRASAQSAESLDEAFARIPRDLALNTAVRMHVSIRGDAFELPSSLRHEVYGIGREAILNAYKHSGAEEIYVTIEHESEGLRLCVKDNGCGIGSTELATGREGHWGLQGMRERAKRIGLQLQFRTAPGTGTEVEVLVPRVRTPDPRESGINAD